VAQVVEHPTSKHKALNSSFALSAIKSVITVTIQKYGNVLNHIFNTLNMDLEKHFEFIYFHKINLSIPHDFFMSI
jgi:hypothetical protein